MERKRSAAAEARRAAKRAAIAPAPALRAPAPAAPAPAAPAPAAPKLSLQEKFALQKAEKRSPAAMERRAARRSLATTPLPVPTQAAATAPTAPALAPAPAPPPAPPAPASTRAPRSAAAEARRAAKRGAESVDGAAPKRPKKATWGAPADDAQIKRNQELRNAFKEDPDALSAEDRARAELLLARDARKAAKTEARGGDSKRAAAFKKRFASDGAAGRGRGRSGKGR